MGCGGKLKEGRITNRHFRVWGRKSEQRRVLCCEKKRQARGDGHKKGVEAAQTAMKQKLQRRKAFSKLKNIETVQQVGNGCGMATDIRAGKKKSTPADRFLPRSREDGRQKKGKKGGTLFGGCGGTRNCGANTQSGGKKGKRKGKKKRGKGDRSLFTGQNRLSDR